MGMNKLLLACVSLVLVALATGAPQGEEGEALQGIQAGLLVREARQADPKKNKNKVQKKEKKNKKDRKSSKDKKERRLVSQRKTKRQKRARRMAGSLTKT